ncbi:MAG: hypothetical protein O3B73_17845, partial [bacterium]|nr:hypothetical protein [bacterium]
LKNRPRKQHPSTKSLPKDSRPVDSPQIDSYISFRLYTALPYICCMHAFIETKLFTRLVQEYVTDQEYAELQKAL